MSSMQNGQKLGEHGDDRTLAISHRVDAVGAGEVERRRRRVTPDDYEQPVESNIKETAGGRKTKM